MNDNNTYNLKEVKNKLHNFTEGKDYFVTPTAVSEIKDYTFFNDRLKSLFGGNNWVPVQVWQEKYEDENVSYRGHFEKGEDYRYSAQSWIYDQNYQGDRGTEDLAEGWMRDWVKGIKWDEHRSIKVHGEAGNFKTGKKFWEKSWTYKGKGGGTRMGATPESKRIESNWERGEVEEHQKYLAEYQEKKHFYEMRLIEEKNCKHGDFPKRGELMDNIRKSIEEFEAKIQYEKDWLAQNANGERAIEPKKDILPAFTCATCYKRIEANQGHYICKEHKEHHCSSECAEQWHKCHMKWVSGDKKDSRPAGCCNCGFKNIQPSDSYCQECGAKLCDEAKSPVKSDLEQENQELRQQLAAVQAELAKVLAELKKLTGKGDQKLEQQQAENEKVINQGSAAEVKAQVQKSQALLGEVKSNPETASQEKPKNGPLPYVVGGSLLVAGIGAVVIGGWWKKRSSKK